MRADETRLYRQDIIAPVAVRHLVEYGDTNPPRPGQFGYWYNFIDYDFADGDRTLVARHYLDEPGTALLLAMPDDDDLTLRVLVFLLMRFERIKAQTPNGYQHLAAAQMVAIRQRMEQHLAASAN
ncbi:hypothetical protein ABIB57_000844 [Devosia sp. UYZn731]|uniref:hypothetical protein n=1 Tax=Devosia sp. UYZn731 TaxID=3156345 RepID=UPI0033984BF9